MMFHMICNVIFPFIYLISTETLIMQPFKPTMLIRPRYSQSQPYQLNEYFLNEWGETPTPHEQTTARSNHKEKEFRFTPRAAATK